MVHAECWGPGVSYSVSISDSLGNVWTQDVARDISGSLAQDIFHSFATQSGSADIVTVHYNNCNAGPSSASVSLETYTGITGIGQIVIEPVVGQSPNPCTTCSNTISITTLATSIIYEPFAVISGNVNPSPFTENSLQTLRQQFATVSPGGGINEAGLTVDVQASIGGVQNLKISYTGNNGGNNDSIFHVAIELLTVPATFAFLSQCYGNCGNPAVTLVNTNSTHTINWNQSITLFYQFQSNINGIIANITTNIAINTATTQQVQLGIYEIPTCGAGQTPFSAACPGGLQRNILFNQPTKGKISLSGGGLPVSNGQWVGLAVTANFKGLDLNDTNTVVPIFFTNGQLPAVLGTSAQFSCTCLTNLYAIVIGNTITGPPPSSGFCGGGIIDCVLPQIVKGACTTQSNSCIQSAAWFWTIFLTIFTVVLLFLALRFIGLEDHLPVPELFAFMFMAWVFVFAGIGLLPAWAPILIFLAVSVAFVGKVKVFE